MAGSGFVLLRARLTRGSDCFGTLQTATAAYLLFFIPGQTFIVNHDGVVYEKDLGPSTASTAAAMTRYDPDKTWQKVQ